ncbi:hypothetical protein N7535_008250 [Penicillium sp. DV-2018c]|nr:hypothetical protein N7461_004289 [Penicillium sp. DV-2018c]KAJ5566612.1 hypothetical protein N7535_008250 [Penicillium sp. DV-2018c]
MPSIIRPHLDPTLEAEYTNIVRTVETQIELLTFKAWRRYEVIMNLEILCHHLAIQAASEERKPRMYLTGYALFQRFCTTLRLCIPGAIVALQSDEPRMTYEVGDDMWKWTGEEEIEHDTVLILQDALRGARSIEWYI